RDLPRAHRGSGRDRRGPGAPAQVPARPRPLRRQLAASRAARRAPGEEHQGEEHQGAGGAAAAAGAAPAAARVRDRRAADVDGGDLARPALQRRRADAAGDLVARLDAGARLAQAGAAIRGERARGAERAGSRPRPQAARPRAVRVVAHHAVEADRRAVRIARAAAVEHPRIVQPLLADAELALPGAGAALAHHPAERAVPVGRRAALGAGAVPQAGIAVRIRRAGAVLHAGAVERAGPLEAIDPRPDEVAGEDVHPHLHAVLLAAAAARGDADLHLTVA